MRALRPLLVRCLALALVATGGAAFAPHALRISIDVAAEMSCPGPRAPALRAPPRFGVYGALPVVGRTQAAGRAPAAASVGARADGFSRCTQPQPAWAGQPGGACDDPRVARPSGHRRVAGATCTEWPRARAGREVLALKQARLI